MFSRSIPDESICDPNQSGDSTLLALRLENNYIDPQKVSPTAFSCVRASSSVVLKPQKTKWLVSETLKTKRHLFDFCETYRLRFRILICQEKSKARINFPSLASPDAVLCWEVEHGNLCSSSLNTVADVICLTGMYYPVISLDWTVTRYINVRFYFPLAQIHHLWSGKPVLHCHLSHLKLVWRWQNTFSLQNPTHMNPLVT